MERGNVGQGTRLGIMFLAAILAGIGLMSVSSDWANARMPPPPAAMIVAETPASTPAAAMPGPIAAAADKTEDELKKLLQGWRHAWASRDATSYLSFYAGNFQGNADSPEQWRAGRKRIIGQAKFIDIQVGQADINLETDGTARITFPLDYASDRFEDHGTKVLQLRRNDGQWLIEGEAFTARL